MPWYGFAVDNSTAGGVNIKGSVPTANDLPATGEENDAYITTDTGDLWVWDGDSYTNAGPVRGPQGPRGPAGTNGDDGTTPTFVDGLVTVLAPGDTPTARFVEVSPGVYRLDLGIPSSSDGTGIPAPATKLAYTYVQNTAAEEWTFTHDLPFNPSGIRISDYDEPDASWNVPIDYDPAAKQFTLTFPVAVRGEVTVS